MLKWLTLVVARGGRDEWKTGFCNYGSKKVVE